MKKRVFVLIVCYCCCALAVVADAQLDSGLQGYWQFNSNALDSSPAGRDLDLMGDPGFSAGLLGCALSLDGNASRFARRPVNDAVFDIGGDDFTIQIWINFDSTSGEQTLIEKFTGGAGPGYTLTKLASNRFQFFASGLSGINSPIETIDVGVWHQIVLRRAGTIIEIFLDGKSIVQSNQTGTVSPSPNPLQIGEREGSQQFPANGLIDEVAFWSRGLSDDEVTQLYNDGNALAILPDPKILLGDINLDGSVNLLDVAPFVDLLSAGAFQVEADFNLDCIVNLLDVEPFIAILAGN